MSVRHRPVDRSHAERKGLNGQRSIGRLDRQMAARVARRWARGTVA